MGTQLPTDDATDDETTRSTAVLDDSADDPEDWVVLPPTVATHDEPDERLVDAVEAAVEEEPNATTDPTLRGSDDSDATLAVLSARFNELPAGDDPHSVEWHAPYVAQERVLAVLDDALPEDVVVEVKNRSALGFYSR